MPLPSDLVTWVLELPTFVVHLRELLNRSPELRESSEKLIDKIVEAVQKYAELHFALRDWKTLHHELQGLANQLQNSTQFDPFLHPTDPPVYPSFEDVERRWRSYETQTLDPFLARKAELSHISPVVIPKKEFRSGRIVSDDFHSNLEQLETSIQSTLTRGPRHYLTSFQEQLQDLEWLLQQGSITADFAIRQIAGDLADLSIDLNAKLEASKG